MCMCLNAWCCKMELEKLHAKVAWVKTCPPWQKIQAAEAALEEALKVLDSLDKRLDALERGSNGKS